MKRIISFLLCLSLVLPAVVEPAHAEESQVVSIPCQYTVGYEVSQTTISGEIHDGYLYVSMDTIAELSGLSLAHDDNEFVLYPSGESKWSSIYVLNTESGTLTESSAFYASRSWDVPLLVEDGSPMASFEHMLGALNAEISCDADSPVPLSVYRPYTIFDVRKSLLKNDCYFNWSEIDLDESYVKKMHTLSSLDSLFLDYNEHFVTDALYSWWSDDVLSATEEQYQDAIYEVLTCLSDADASALDSSTYETYQLQNDVFGMTDDMMELIGVESEAIDLLGLSAQIGEYGTTAIDQINTYIQYKNVSDVQSAMLDTTFLSSRDNSIFKEKDLKAIHNAAQHMQNRLTDGALGNTAAICDAVIATSSKVVEGAVSKVTPIFALIDTATTITKLLPGGSTAIDMNKAVNTATHCNLLGVFARQEFVRINDKIRSSSEVASDLLDDAKQILTFSLQASYAVREALIGTDLLSDAAVLNLRQKNQDVLELLLSVENCSTRWAPEDISNTIDWNEVKDKLPAINCNNLVTDAYSKTQSIESYNAEYHIPKINLAGAEISRINNEIYDFLYYGNQEQYFWGIEKELAVMNSGDWPDCGSITYDWYVNGDVLSLIIKCLYDTHVTDQAYFVYNLSISTGELLLKDKVYAAVGLSQAEYHNRVNQVLGSEFFRLYNEWYSEQNGYDDFFHMQFEKTISNENIIDSVPYINKDGQLCIIGRIYSLAGADYYWYDLNVENCELTSAYKNYMELRRGDSWDTFSPGDWGTPSAPETINEHLEGTWSTSDGKLRITFNPDSLHLEYPFLAGAVLDGDFLSINFTSAKKEGATYAIYESGEILGFHDYGSHSTSYKLQNGVLVDEDNQIYYRLDDLLLKQLRGVWKNEQYELTFEEDTFSITDKLNGGKTVGKYYIISEEKVMMCKSTSPYFSNEYYYIDEYYVTGNQLNFQEMTFTREGVDTSYATITQSKEQLLGTWVYQPGKSTGYVYELSDDMKYEHNLCSYSTFTGELISTTLLEAGDFEIIDSTTIHCYIGEEHWAYNELLYMPSTDELQVGSQVYSRKQ